MFRLSQAKSPKQQNSDFYRTLSLNLRYFRHKRQLTQEQLAARAEISAKYVSLIESSSFTNPPTLEVLFDLAASLEVEPFQLFKPL
ncbi:MULTISPECIES: helix-turn-helix domain-containing protein [unclassified Candidatus Paralachnospira]|uniref:helix-turn-helix domain-containing protein n=1 Tax=unclassified Candidatus Paralachnospira TaxID=3099471 RepID=UPI003F8DD831